MVAAIGLLASTAFATPAQASLSISSFSLTPSSTQAGGTTTTPGPNLNLSAQFSTTNGDSPDNMLLSLAPGLLANPSIVPFCTQANFTADNCSSASQIGTGTVTGTAPQFGTTLNLPATAYLVQPTGSEIADVGLIVTFFDYPVATQLGPVQIRTTPDVGINIPFNGLPNTIEGVPVLLNGINLTLAGAVGGQPFTRNPTSCSAATSSIVVNSYNAQTTNVTSNSSFTPTGCSSLPFAPTVTGTVSKDSGDSGIAMTATITSAYNQADSQSINMVFPFSASPNLGALLADECTPATTGNPWAACPVVGTATVKTPLLSQTLNANIYLQQHTNALPTLEIVLPAPFNITLTGTPVLTGSSVQALVANVPDIPITNLSLDLPGGSKSLFLAGVHLCSQSQSFGGTFTAWSGATASPSATATVTGCPTTTTTTSTTTPTTTTTTTSSATSTGGAKTLTATQEESAGTAGSSSRSAARAAGGSGGASHLAARSTGQLSVSGLQGASPKLFVAVGGGKRTSAIRSVTLRLPPGFDVAAGLLARGLRVAVDGHSVAASTRVQRRLLTVSFVRTGRVVFITLRAPALRLSPEARARGGRRLALTATVVCASGRPTTLRLQAR
jgi:hypothetical protein